MKRRLFLSGVFALAMLFAACGSTSGETETAETQASSEESGDIEADGPSETGEEVSEGNEELSPAQEQGEQTEENEQEETEAQEEPEEEQEISCQVTTDTELYVDVPLDDPDGGLNVRADAGLEFEVIVTVPRSEAVITTGACKTVSGSDWYEVTVGTANGWASSNFLSDMLVFNPGLGNDIDDAANVGLTGDTLEEIVTAIALSYGFEQDALEITELNIEGADAIGGEAFYELSGLRDDASNGYQLDIVFNFLKDDDGEIIGFETTRVTNRAVCTRGVTSDGLCI